jgi:hypothetical protein
VFVLTAALVTVATIEVISCLTRTRLTRRALSCKLPQTTYIHFAAVYTRSALGFSLAGWDDNQIGLCDTRSPPVAAYRVLFVLLADPLLSGRGTATGNLWRNVNGAALGKFPGREVTSAIDQTMCFDGSSAKRLLAPAPTFARDSVE